VKEFNYVPQNFSKRRDREYYNFMDVPLCPYKVRFKELVKIMVDADIKNLEEMKQCQDVIRKLSANKSIQ
jgi:hypothetical protein